MRIGSSNVTVLVAGEGAAADSDESSPVADAVKVEAVREDIPWDVLAPVPLTRRRGICPEP